jgi:hypothetical protein
MSLSADDLLRLARAYSDHVGRSLVTIGVKAANNDKVFTRLAAGKTCTVRTLERAACWLAAHWPADLPWPADIPIPARRHCDGAANAGIRRSPGAGRG